MDEGFLAIIRANDLIARIPSRTASPPEGGLYNRGNVIGHPSTGINNWRGKRYGNELFTGYRYRVARSFHPRVNGVDRVRVTKYRSADLRLIAICKSPAESTRVSATRTPVVASTGYVNRARSKYLFFYPPPQSLHRRPLPCRTPEKSKRICIEKKTKKKKDRKKNRQLWG